MKIAQTLLFFLSLLTISLLHAESLKEDKEHVQVWNQFALDVYELHLRQIQGRVIEEQRSVGGYANDKDFYLQIDYIDKKSGLRLSRIRWEKADPQTIHAIDVFIHDRKGRVIRDYSASFLPHFRNAPVQTLITLHQYNKNLHAFRIFDASAELIGEQCHGKYRREPVRIRLDYDDLMAERRKPTGLMVSEVYQACFAQLALDAGPWLRAERPQP